MIKMITVSLNDVLMLNNQLELETRLAITHVTGDDRLSRFKLVVKSKIIYNDDGTQVFTYAGEELVIFGQIYRTGDTMRREVERLYEKTPD